MGQLSLPVRLPRNETAHIHTFIYISEAEQLAARGSEGAFQCIAARNKTFNGSPATHPQMQRWKSVMPSSAALVNQRSRHELHCLAFSFARSAAFFTFLARAAAFFASPGNSCLDQCRVCRDCENMVGVASDETPNSGANGASWRNRALVA